MAPNDDFQPDEGDFDPDDPAWAADELGSTSTFMFLAPDEETRAVTELYGVFRRPRNDADRRTGELARRWGALDVGGPPENELFEDELPEHWPSARPLGDVIEEEGRLVLSGLGGAEDMLYVAPTTTEAIAHAVLPNGGGGCGRPGPDGLVLATVHRRESLVVQGLVADPIVAVDLVVNGETRRARMGENAFGLRIEGERGRALEKVILRREDGTTNELELPRTPGPDDLELPQSEPT